jgi:protein phosphatase methylesterase 1
LKNVESAKVSIPSQLIQKDGVYTWKAELDKTEPFWKGLLHNCICTIVVITLLGWFTGLSKAFLSAKAAKLLILAGTDRLDKELTIAQMQGKFQLALLPACGHAIHEDV